MKANQFSQPQSRTPLLVIALTCFTAAGIMLLTLLTGCGGMVVSGGSTFREKIRTVIEPNGDVIQGTNVIHGSGTNTGMTKPVSFVTYRSARRDTHYGAGGAMLDDQALNGLRGTVSNQTALGGSRTFGIESLTNGVSTNASKVIDSTGTAVGNGAAAFGKKAVTPVP